MFRSLIYRTDFGNTIVREDPSAAPVLNPNEASVFTDFIVPANQPLYLWRENGSGDIIPNIDQNINNWLAFINPITAEDEVNFGTFTGYTATTQSQIDNKIDKVSGATVGNIPTFLADGSIDDSGIDIDTILSGLTSGGTIVLLEDFTGYTATTDTRLQGIESDIVFLSGATDQNTSDINAVSATTDQNTTDITTVSAATDQNTADIATVSVVTNQNTTDIATVSAATDQNASDIAFISGVTDTKQDALSAGEGINSTLLSNNDIIQVDLSAFTAIGGLDITLTGSTDAVINDLRSIATGLEYGGDYNASFTVRSLVDKGYVDAVASGLDLKESVRVATTSGETDIDLALGTFGGVIDGYTLQDGDRVLIKNQDSAREDNGIYIWSAGSSTFARAIDFDNPNVTAGAFTFTETGTTNSGAGYVLVTPDPVNIGTSELIFTQFSSTGSLSAGNGINIINGVVSVDGNDLAGDFINFSSNQFNVTGLTTIANFNVYTGATETRLQGIESNIVFLSGATDQNTGDIAIVSAATDQNTTDIATVSATTDQNASDIAFISGVTDTKLDTDVFTGYTASTVSNELFLIHTGGTDINTIATTAIVWNSGATIGDAYTWTGGSGIFIDETGEYEVSYNLPFTQLGNNNNRGIATNLILNNTTVINNTAAADLTSRSNARGSAVLASVNLSLNAGDRLDLVGFRTGQNGVTETAINGTILIKKKNRLQ